MHVSVAPMMNCTDRHDRYFLRLIASDVRLYTEMVTTHALMHGDRKYLLTFHPAEKPLALQLGGSDPNALAVCAKMGEDYGYDEINLNVGCPSDRVHSGQFGACLMLKPQHVAECIFKMQEQVRIPVTIKCRIGVDHQDSYDSLYQFVECIAAAGCKIFIIHARKAWLSGLSPKQNREIPPLRYDVVWQLKQDFPDRTIIVNGGITTLAQIEEQLTHVDGVMLGRAAYSNPYWLSEIQANYFKNKNISTRLEIIQQFIPYISQQIDNGVRLNSITRHLLGLFRGQSGASAWRRYLSEHAHQPGAGAAVLEKALLFV